MKVEELRCAFRCCEAEAVDRVWNALAPPSLTSALFSRPKTIPLSLCLAHWLDLAPQAPPVLWTKRAGLHVYAVFSSPVVTPTQSGLAIVSLCARLYNMEPLHARDYKRIFLHVKESPGKMCQWDAGRSVWSAVVPGDVVERLQEVIEALEVAETATL